MSDKYDETAQKCLAQMGIAFGDDNSYIMLSREIAAILRERFPEPAESAPAPREAKDSNRCAICGWPLSKTDVEGCMRGNCSMRPRPQNLYDPERAEREVIHLTPEPSEGYVEAQLEAVPLPGEDAIDRAKAFVSLALEHLGDADTLDAVDIDLRRAWQAFDDAKAQLAAEREQCRKAMVASQAEVDMLYVRAEKAEAEAKALREVLKTVEQPLALFVMQHPIWTLPSGVVQDPAGSHKALDVLRAALAKEAKL